MQISQIGSSIDQYFEVPYAPALNGVAERINQTLLISVRCLLNQANLDAGYYWCDAMLKAEWRTES
jgi:hypothetical protein